MERLDKNQFLNFVGESLLNFKITVAREFKHSVFIYRMKYRCLELPNQAIILGIALILTKGFFYKSANNLRDEDLISSAEKETVTPLPIGEMVFIPIGQYEMGGNNEQADRDEFPKQG